MQLISSIKCRLCGGTAVYQFKKIILGKYDVSFFRCENCNSLETEEPFWLAESYLDPKRPLDISAISRTQFLQIAIYLVTSILNLPESSSYLDWGGGDGLLVRMLRDIGLNAFLWETYTENTYAIGFEGNPANNYTMVTAFEVFEHLPHPFEEIKKMFDCQPEALMISTNFYTGQDVNWSYLNPLTGRHVFFYSRDSIKFLAKFFGYQFETYSSGIALFLRNNLAPIKLFFLRKFFSGSFGMAKSHFWRKIFYCYFFAVEKPNLITSDQQQVMSFYELHTNKKERPPKDS